MHATHCLVGCVLYLAAAGSAAATNGEAPPDLGSSAPMTIGTSAHNTVTTAATSPDSNASSEQPSVTSEGESPPPASSNPANPDGPAVHHAAAHHVGWQSLLPGSIQ